MCASVIPPYPVVVREDEGVNVLQHECVCRVVEDELYPLEEVPNGCMPRDISRLLLQIEAQFEG